MQSAAASAPSSKDTTPMNSPVRPVRNARGRSSRQSTRPVSQMDENIYECVTPGPLPYTPLQVRSQAFSSSSDSDSDFRTPHASPRFVRHNPKPKTKSSNKVQSSASKASLASSRASVSSSKGNNKPKMSSPRVKPSSSVILRDRGKSYENTLAFPQNTQNRLSSTSLASTTSSSSDRARPKLIPPRACQQPIPTPRTRSLARRSREPSQETTSPRGTGARPSKREPYYKVPPPNPREVTPPLPASGHHYEYLDLEGGGQDGLQEVIPPPTPASERKSSASLLNKNSLKIYQNSF